MRRIGAPHGVGIGWMLTIQSVQEWPAISAAKSITLHISRYAMLPAVSRLLWSALTNEGKEDGESEIKVVLKIQ